MPGRQPAPDRAVQVIAPPGGYGDAPVYLRVDKALGGDAWPQPGYHIECNDWRCALDPTHDYVPVHNSYSAFVYARWITERGVPEGALAVVRLADHQAEQ